MPAWLRAIRFVAITDRTKMVDADTLASGDWTVIAAEMAAAIVPLVRPDVLIQIREKDLDGGPLLAITRAALATGARVVVNDRLDVALAAGAHGVHLPERGLPILAVPAIVKAVAPDRRDDFAIGVSTHSLDGVARAAREGADVIQLGPIWSTPGKGPALGPLRLREASGVRGALLVAVGGIDTPERRDTALHHGAGAVAAIRAFWAPREHRHLQPELLSRS